MSTVEARGETLALPCPKPPFSRQIFALEDVEITDDGEGGTAGFSPGWDGARPWGQPALRAGGGLRTCPRPRAGDVRSQSRALGQRIPLPAADPQALGALPATGPPRGGPGPVPRSF